MKKFNDPIGPQAATASKEDKEKKKRRIRIFIIFFIIIFLISEGILLYRLGGLAGKNIGKAVDTIVLSPDQTRELPLSICGRVQYSSGHPAAGLTVELHSDPKATTTDRNGDFYFENVEYGNHTLTVTDKNGNKKVLTDLNIQRDNSITDGKQLFTESSDGTWYFKVPEETLNIEFNMQMNETETAMNVVQGSVSAMLTDSWVITYYGSGKASYDGPIMTLHGSVMLSDGTIHLHEGGAILPDGLYIDTDGEIYRNGEKAGSAELPGDYAINTGDLTVKTPDGSLIHLKDAVTDLPDGTIVSGKENKATFPDGTVIDNAQNSVTTPDGYVISSDGTVKDPAGNKVSGASGILPDGTIIGSDGIITTPDGSVIRRPEPDHGYIIDNGTGSSTARPIEGPSSAGVFPASGSASASDKTAYNSASGASGETFGTNSTNSSDNKTSGSASGTSAGNHNGTNSSSGSNGNGSGGNYSGNNQQSSSTGGSAGDNTGSGTGNNTGTYKPSIGDNTGSSTGGDSGNTGGNTGGGTSSGGPSGGSSGEGHSNHLNVVDKKTDKEWHQLTTIDLFSGAGAISPGASADYDFYIRNGVRSSVRFRMTIEEADHDAGAIPLEYRLRDSSGYIAGTADNKNGWLTASELESVWVTLNERGSVNYTLEWRWPYERGTTAAEIAANDAADTALGNVANSAHMIHVKIYAEAVS